MLMKQSELLHFDCVTSTLIFWLISDFLQKTTVSMSDFLRKMAVFMSDFLQKSAVFMSDFLQNSYICRK